MTQISQRGRVTFFPLADVGNDNEPLSSEDVRGLWDSAAHILNSGVPQTRINDTVIVDTGAWVASEPSGIAGIDFTDSDVVLNEWLLLKQYDVPWGIDHRGRPFTPVLRLHGHKLDGATGDVDFRAVLTRSDTMADAYAVNQLGPLDSSNATTAISELINGAMTVEQKHARLVADALRNFAVREPFFSDGSWSGSHTNTNATAQLALMRLDIFVRTTAAAGKGQLNGVTLREYLA